MNMRSVNISLLLGLAILLSGSCRETREPFEEIALEQYRRYPLMQMQDFYKLAFQAAMGPAHLGADSVMIFSYLKAEIDTLKPSNTEPLEELISPDGRIVRVNLRSFVTRGGKAGHLTQAILYSNKRITSSERLLNIYWNSVENLAKKNSIPFQSDSLHFFFLKMNRNIEMPVHHSVKYMNAYVPSYRVILKECMPLLKLAK
jgi:hypothetical protein